jgi:hypothetical protein
MIWITLRIGFRCDPQKWDFHLSEAVREGYSFKRIKKEVAKCTVFFADCHAEKLLLDFTPPLTLSLPLQFLSESYMNLYEHRLIISITPGREKTSTLVSFGK